MQPFAPFAKERKKLFQQVEDLRNLFKALDTDLWRSLKMSLGQSCVPRSVGVSFKGAQTKHETPSQSPKFRTLNVECSMCLKMHSMISTSNQSPRFGTLSDEYCRAAVQQRWVHCVSGGKRRSLWVNVPRVDPMGM